MWTTPETPRPNGVFPCDVTSPGPDQRPGVVKSRRVESHTKEGTVKPPIRKDSERQTGDTPASSVEQ